MTDDGIIRQEKIHEYRLTFTQRPLEGLVPEESSRHTPWLYHVTVERETEEGNGDWRIVDSTGYHSFTNKTKAARFYRQCVYDIVGG